MIILDGETPASVSSVASAGVIFYDPADGRVKARLPDGSLVIISPFSKLENQIINGGFIYAQRQAPGTLTTISQTASRQFGPDRMSITNENASVQYQRVDTNTAPETGLAARYYGKFKKITANGKMVISHPLEGTDTMKLRGRAVRVQAKMKYSVASSMTARLGLLQLNSTGTIDTIPGIANGAPSGTFVSAFNGASADPTFGTNLALVAPRLTESSGTIVGNAVNCVLSTAWARYSAVFDVPSGCKNLIPVIFNNAQAVLNDELNISEFGLYDGEEIVDWGSDIESIEFLKCLRYYNKSFNRDIAPAQNAGVTGAIRGHVSVAAAVAAQPIGWRLPPLRAPNGATYVTFNPSAANAFARNVTAGTDATATSVISATAGEQGLEIQFTGIAAWTVAQAVMVHATVDNEI